MKTRESAKPKKQSVVVKDLETKKNPKGGVTITGTNVRAVTITNTGTLPTSSVSF
jgi:hypothetical protein